MADKKVLFYDTTYNVPDESTSSDRAVFPGGAKVEGAALEMSSQKITGLQAGTISTDAVNKGQLDAAVVSGGKLKELLLHVDQLDDTNGIYSALVAYITANPTAGDTFVLTDGTTTRTYGATSGGDVQYTIGATAADTMQNLATAITGDGSGAWDAVWSADGLDELNSAAGVIVIYENTTAAGDNTSRAYGTWTTQANLQVVEYAAGGTVDSDYASNVNATLPTSDPSEARFGLRRQVTALEDYEIHGIRADNYLYAWDDTGNTWFSMVGPTSLADATAASGGGTKGKVTFDSDKGLGVTGGVAEVTIESDGAIVFDAGNGGLELNLETTNPTLAITTNELGVKYSSTASGLTQDANGLHVNTDDSTIQINASGQLEVLSVDDANRLEKVYTGSGAIAVGDPVYFAGADTVAAGDATDLATNKGNIIGISLTADAGGGNITVVTAGHEATGVLSGATPGDDWYLDATSGMAAGAPSGSGRRRLIRCGYANTADDLFVQILDLGIRAIP